MKDDDFMNRINEKLENKKKLTNQEYMKIYDQIAEEFYIYLCNKYNIDYNHETIVNVRPFNIENILKSIIRTNLKVVDNRSVNNHLKKMFDLGYYEYMEKNPKLVLAHKPIYSEFQSIKSKIMEAKNNIENKEKQTNLEIQKSKRFEEEDAQIKALLEAFTENGEEE